MHKSIPFTLSALIALSGCASQSGWTPTVDTYGDPRAQYITQDENECRAIAQRASGYTPQEVAKGTVVGGLLGAAAGAAIGAALGSPGKGAAVGAAAGGFGGGTRQGMQAEARYKQVFRNCMRNRGHNVLD